MERIHEARVSWGALSSLLMGRHCHHHGWHVGGTGAGDKQGEGARHCGAAQGRSGLPRLFRSTLKSSAGEG
eukprot:3497021-Alexandrium_andersonii.AAC.1